MVTNNDGRYIYNNIINAVIVIESKFDMRQVTKRWLLGLLAIAKIHIPRFLRLVVK